MSDANQALITRFYQAFQRLDAESMVACYSEDITFSDPVFGTLRGQDVGDMWRMLTTRAKDFSLTFDHVQANQDSASAHWVARYLFSQTGRTVVNDIQARFVIRDGLILQHDDGFDFWRWSRQALGLPGLLLGWSPMLQNKVRLQAFKGLRAFQQAR
ncbi:nuclear transport factor 2 family protein [Pseudomonas guariconensis]|uniref:nuclear transport factor 2 family protein n=1 Tax=Pseudomonas guariconensis TaxID=1288410 RepID=UPI0018A906FE|nr:nuclear transport factor 2 family protein [Pseudomonas guariconensis]MBF8741208.1 nuclear transport factor 2 family protein [Pseudomonas guariconensis]MBF8751918.1 nuclear transport factor 2 family protein [Pseudomonas guariconensis]